jgi:hypothetical protein
MTEELFPDGHWKKPSATIIGLQSTFAAVATLCVALRFYARISLKRRLAVDDFCIVIGLGFAIARAVIASLSSQSGWASRTGPQAKYQIPYYTHYFERRLFYALGAFFIRSGVLTYYLRLFPRALRRLRCSSWVLLFLSFLQFLQLTVVLAVYCNDIADLYHGDINKYHNAKCSDAYAFTYSGAIGDAAIDAMIYVLPIPYVWGLRKLRLDQRLGLVFVFGVGIIACVFALLQIPFIIKNYRHNPATGQSWFGSQVSLFIGLELALGLIAASLPDLRGLIARILPGFMAAFRHTDESSRTYSNTNSHELPGHGRQNGDSAHTPTGGVPIGRGVRFGGEGVGWSKKVKKPDWLRSDRGSLWRDSPTTSEAPNSRGKDAALNPVGPHDVIVDRPTETTKQDDDIAYENSNGQQRDIEEEKFCKRSDSG